MNRQHLFSFVLFLLLSSPAGYAQQGLKAEYYNGTDFEEFVASRIDEKIDFYWNQTPPVPGLHPHVCSVRWTGLLTAPETGTYTFSARVDDGIRVWVGGVKVIDDWNLNDIGLFRGEVELEAGRQYELKVEFFNALIEAEITLLWKLPGQKGYFNWQDEQAAVVDAAYLSHTPDNPKPLIAQSPVFQHPQFPKPPPPPPSKPKKTKPEKVVTEPVVSADTLERYIPRNIEFEQAESILLPASYAALDILAEFLKRNPDYRLRIEGHTDVAGDRVKNRELSERRAWAVAAYLVKKGIDADRIEAKGYGSSRPLVPSDGKTYHPENRRVEFTIINNG